jgi:hypothetical protein
VEKVYAEKVVVERVYVEKVYVGTAAFGCPVERSSTGFELAR